MMDRYYATLRTPIGWVLLVGRDEMLTQVGLPKPTREASAADAPADSRESPDRFGDLSRRFGLYFAGHPVAFSDEAVLFGGVGEFEEKVLRETMKVPYGKLTTYKALAGAVGCPGGARAVGNAMARNPMPIVVPCHRVVKSDGGLGGYGGGLDVKRRLLNLEGVEL